MSGFTIPNAADASYPAQSQPDAIDFAIMRAALNGTGMEFFVFPDGGKISAQASPNMTVQRTAGVVRIEGRYWGMGHDEPVIAIPAADATYPRFDLVAVRVNAGATDIERVVYSGTPAANPVFPTIPDGPSTFPSTSSPAVVVLAAIYVPAGATAITNAMIIDKRCPAAATFSLNTQLWTAAGGAPDASSDRATWGFYPGTLWTDETTGTIDFCMSAATGAAVWRGFQAEYVRRVAQGQGFKWETFTRAASVGATSLVSGTQYYTLVPLTAGETISALAVDVNVGGSSLSLVKTALVSTGGGILASTGDVKASFTSGGIKAPAFSAAYTPSADGVAFACILCTHTGSGPTLVRGNAVLDPSQYLSNPRVGGRTTGLTDLSSAAPAASAGPQMWFAGV